MSNKKRKEKIAKALFIQKLENRLDKLRKDLRKNIKKKGSKQNGYTSIIQK